MGSDFILQLLQTLSKIWATQLSGIFQQFPVVQIDNEHSIEQTKLENTRKIQFNSSTTYWVLLFVYSPIQKFI